MGREPCIDGKIKIEIDEWKFITYNIVVDGYLGWYTGQYNIRIF